MCDYQYTHRAFYIYIHWKTQDILLLLYPLNSKAAPATKKQLWNKKGQKAILDEYLEYY